FPGLSELCSCCSPRPRPRSPPFPYTTLFRSRRLVTSASAACFAHHSRPSLRRAELQSETRHDSSDRGPRGAELQSETRHPSVSDGASRGGNHVVSSLRGKSRLLPSWIEALANSAPPHSRLPRPSRPPRERRPRHRLPSGRKRPAIALLLDFINFFAGGFESEIRRAFHARCTELDLDLFIVFGRAVEEPHPWGPANNAIFDLVGSRTVDGIVSISTSLGSYCGPEGMRRFLERYRGLPSCSVGVPLERVPSVLVDNEGGMKSVVDHLIEEHGCRRLLFIGGPLQNAEAESRLRAYYHALERHGLPLDPALVTTGTFMHQSGQAAVQRLLDAGVPFDGVVSANHSMALGAIEMIRARGLRTPRDLCVVGFDDLLLARLGNPAHDRRPAVRRDRGPRARARARSTRRQGGPRRLHVVHGAQDPALLWVRD